MTDQRFNRSLKPKRKPDSAAANQKARKKLSPVELATGRSPEWWEENHRAQRARVRARWLA